MFIPNLIARDCQKLISFYKKVFHCRSISRSDATYFDSIRSVLDEKKFSHRILMEYEELSSGNMVKEHQKDYERFFIVREAPKRGRKVEYNQEARHPQEEQYRLAIHKLVSIFC